MPNNANAAKADRQSQKRRLLNRSQHSSLRTLVKKFRTSLGATTEGAATEGAAPAVTLSEVSKRLDQAGAKRLIHPKKASRLKSRLAKAQNKAAAAK
ncbi:MAG: 30S ribosomal protein S20 [Planctomycetota bacterium]|nr:MAG: 30S ribosomal protein S20 [Planctomycetota bacterium]GDY10391.1 30S ribosomal protein S20 [Planctomycetia bacterium]